MLHGFCRSTRKTSILAPCTKDPLERGHRTAHRQYACGRGPSQRLALNFKALHTLRRVKLPLSFVFRATSAHDGDGRMAADRKRQCGVVTLQERRRPGDGHDYSFSFQRRVVSVAELKMDAIRERELKESLERQLVDETRARMLWQKRLQKERKARRRLQEQLELEMKRRAQLEDALRGAVGNDAIARELDLDRKSKSAEQPKPELLGQDLNQLHQKQDSPSPQPNQQLHPTQGHQIQLQRHHQQQIQLSQFQKHQQPSPVSDRERQSPAVLENRSNFYKNSVLFGGAS
ncbi:Dachshund-like protein 1 [Frankliniella fusca]|uniref:Dachshund-like protein 1 n=1 Tax=Frankliniella fusca TaxID=407009 RepID=A0AAE1H4U8_9NEOP|nr:Dachshund-like protein 1 [Frankliniella fusca]